MDLNRKREVEAQLRAAGYAVPQIMQFTQGKVTMYRHKPFLNDKGMLAQPCGDVVPNQPAHPDHKARLVYRGLRDWPFRGVCICNPCVCRGQMTAEAFGAHMRAHGLDPDEVRPKGVIQAVNAAEVKPDIKPMPIVANAAVAEVQAVEKPSGVTIHCTQCDHTETGKTKGKALGRMSVHTKKAHAKVKAAA